MVYIALHLTALSWDVFVSYVECELDSGNDLVQMGMKILEFFESTSPNAEQIVDVSTIIIDQCVETGVIVEADRQI